MAARGRLTGKRKAPLEHGATTLQCTVACAACHCGGRCARRPGLFHVSPCTRSSWARASRSRASMTCGWRRRTVACSPDLRIGAEPAPRQRSSVDASAARTSSARSDGTSPNLMPARREESFALPITLRGADGFDRLAPAIGQPVFAEPGNRQTRRPRKRGENSRAKHPTSRQLNRQETKARLEESRTENET